jgi:hypothetical protein
LPDPILFETPIENIGADSAKNPVAVTIRVKVLDSTAALIRRQSIAVAGVHRHCGFLTFTLISWNSPDRKGRLASRAIPSFL